MNKPKSCLSLLLAGTLTLLLSSCDKEPDPGPIDTSGMTTAEFFQTLPTWDEFAENPVISEAAPTGEMGTETSQTFDMPTIQEDGSIDTL